jgi:uncharacterized protein (DUF362 family)
MKKVYIQGVSKGSSQIVLERKIREILMESTNNLSWLSKGQTVLLKPALNSGNPYPATTHPAVIKVFKEEIEKKSGKVIVGDQSGIGWVLQGKRGVVRGSSIDCFIKSGMSESGAILTAFEDGDWENDFVHFASRETKSWPNGFWITSWIEKVDHIISLPRVATHGQAGVSLGFKNMVGILREDSRVEFHSHGPFSPVINKGVKELGIKTKYEKGGGFFEMITEISAAVREKLRLTVFVGTKTLETLGPDIGSQVEPETGLIIASDDQLAAEVMAIAFLKNQFKNVPILEKMGQKILVKMNGKIKDLTIDKVWDNAFVKHALDLGWGSKEITYSWKEIPEEMKEDLLKWMEES